MIIRGSVAVVRDRSIKSQSGATSSFNSIFVFKILCSDDDTDKVAMVVLCPSLPLLVNSPTPQPLLHQGNIVNVDDDDDDDGDNNDDVIITKTINDNINNKQVIRSYIVLTLILLMKCGPCC